jgi:hypothetical protein
MGLENQIAERNPIFPRPDRSRNRDVYGVPETAPADAFERNVREAGVVFDGPAHRVLESPGFVHARPDPVNQQPLRPKNRDQGDRRSNEKVFDKSIHHYGRGAEAQRRTAIEHA